MKYILAIKNNKSKNDISEIKANISKRQLRACFRQGFKASPKILSRYQVKEIKVINRFSFLHSLSFLAYSKHSINVQ